ncbi:Phosphotransferase enzyme family protein [Nocardioides dokdonensis FR1436]|uniref:Phosphotransferase enzyme family protein n=1 Tax=Nocardioides dokdonensis FR1436 TaxID=1300347 RepID=A0A1A9GR03_9ACTN|nr:aminoglycoside phosphotransferase family protein [Nocardioides dokdonensis]ANH40033.1 Phosphotransferase enzyme family protein [Nocardioides dokdonensis FR1436]
MGTAIDRAIIEASSALVGEQLRFVELLGGGQHARTILADGRSGEYVLRRFAPGDPAVEHEVEVLARLAPLADLTPRVVAHTDRPPPGSMPGSMLGSIMVTSRVRGAPPAPTLSLMSIAAQMAAALARIHRESGDGLREVPVRPPDGRGPMSDMARAGWPALECSERVLTHYDYWCGNALWVEDRLTGIVDWSGARSGPRGVDVAWCRQDLVLLGSPTAADAFLCRYESCAGVAVPDIHAWDVQAAAQADSAVETWAPNYHQVGRPQLDAPTLRTRLDAWIADLLQIRPAPR